MVRHDDTKQSAHDIIRKIMGNRPIALSIQRELVEDNKNLVDTTAGEAVNRELNEQIRRLQYDLKLVQEEMTDASVRKDEETRQELEDERSRLEKQMGKRRAEAKYIRRMSDLTGRQAEEAEPIPEKARVPRW